MKKLSTLLVSALLVLAITMMCACGGDATFNGNYKRSNEKDIAETLSQIDEKQDESLDLSKGFEIKMIMKMSGKLMEQELTANMDYNMKIKLVDEEVGLSGTMKVDSTASDAEGETVDASVYYKDGNFYINGAYAGQEGKYIMPMDLDDVLGMIFSSSEGFELDINEFLNTYDSDKISIYTDFSEEGYKFKFEAKDIKEDMASVEKLLAFSVFDAEYNLTACKCEMKAEIMGLKTDLNIEIKPFSGEISYPSDLDSYSNIPSVM